MRSLRPCKLISIDLLNRLWFCYQLSHHYCVNTLSYLTHTNGNVMSVSLSAIIIGFTGLKT